MKHNRLMKYPRRFCVECNKDQFLYVVNHATFSVYHCECCKSEVQRVGDGINPGQIRRVAGGIDTSSISADVLGGKPSEVLASENPDVLSDEHAMWPTISQKDEFERRRDLGILRSALYGLTARQSQILRAVELYKDQARAASQLGISRGTVAATLRQIKNKLAKTLNNSGAEGIQGKGEL